MTSQELRKKFLEFFEQRGHKIVPSSSLIPDDPSVLLTTAGMQQFKKYYTDPSLAPAQNVASIQKCFRTSDIEEVGDESHLTFFEMLGNFSFGGYFKEEAIKYAKEFLESLELKIDYVTVFSEEGDINPDKESEEIWRKLGVKDIRKAGRKDNFWGPTGAEGPCGPTTEIYINGMEIWNIVFNEYYKKPDGTFGKLKTPGVDTGMGLERLAMVVNNKKTIFETDLFEPFLIYLISGNVFQDNLGRIISDHLRASAFLLADGLRPSNKEAGYILRRLLRRVIVQNKKFGFPQDFIEKKMEEVIDKYGEFPDYNNLKIERKNILDEFRKEASKFNVTLDKGLKEFLKKYPEREAQINAPQERGTYKTHDLKVISGEDAFFFHQTYGLTIDVIKDLARRGRHSVDEESFNREFKKHQEISRAGVEKKFGGHGLLLDTGELKASDEEELKKVTRLHTATHLLQAALRKVLGDNVKQAGSDITAERMRFDFSFERKLTDEEIKKVEDLVNFAVSKKYQVEMKEMALEDALKLGALHFFPARGGSAFGGKEKYPPKVKVYSVVDFKADPPEIFSRELCGGPHVKNTSEIGRFKILKQEAVGAGLRRIRATVIKHQTPSV